jgi:uncharacterized protein YuzB (UPF0349 family)
MEELAVATLMHYAVVIEKADGNYSAYVPMYGCSAACRHCPAQLFAVNGAGFRC